jgi:hypothetical protein
VTRIELQAVGGVVLAAVGLWYDDYDPATSESPVTEDLLNVLTYTTGVETNDTTFLNFFPYVQRPWSGTGKCSGEIVDQMMAQRVSTIPASSLGLSTVSIGDVLMTNYPNPVRTQTTIRYTLDDETNINIDIFDQSGRLVTSLINETQTAGVHEVQWNAAQLPSGVYFARATTGDAAGQQILKIVKTK